MKSSILFLLLVLSYGFTAQASPLKANASSISITPPISMKYPLGGYGERMNKPAEAVHDSIYAKALVLKKGDRKYAIITLDLLGLPNNVKTDLIKRLPGMGWNLENMMLLPSHSHGSLEMAALNSKNNLNNANLGIFQPELLEFVVNQLVTLVKAADQNYNSVKIGTGSATLRG